MARLTITNNNEIHLTILERDKRAGFADSITNDKSGPVLLAVHKKKRHPVENYLDLPNGDYMAAVGTFIYNKAVGEKALAAAYSDFTGDVETFRLKAMGVYLVAVKKYGRIYVFTDKYAVLKTYYYRGAGNRWVLSNSLSAVGETVANTAVLDINELALVEKAFTGAVIGKDTIIKGIYELSGLEYIVINPLTGSLDVTKLPYSRQRWDYSSLSIDYAVEIFSEMLKEKLKTLGEVFGDNIRLCSTGGIDNRTLLAGFLTSGVKPGLAYGIGNSPLTNTRSRDLEINKIISEKYGLDLYIMDWANDNDNFSRYFDEGFAKHGFYAAVYGGNQNFFEEFELRIPGNPGLIEFGYFGETLRNRPWVDNFRESSFTIDTFLNDFYLKDNIAGGRNSLKEICHRYDDFYEYIRSKFIENADLFGIDRKGDMFDLNDFAKLYNIWFRSAESPVANIINQFTCMSCIYASHDLHEFSFDLPADFKINEKFSIKVLARLYPEILDIPFFSQTKFKTLDRKSMELTADFSARSGFLKKAYKTLEASGLGSRPRRALKKTYHFLTGKKTTDVKRAAERELSRDLREFFISFSEHEQKNASRQIIETGKYDSHPRPIVSFSQHIYYLNKLRQGNE